MELKDFIAASMTQIIEGILEAYKKTQTNIRMENPQENSNIIGYEIEKYDAGGDLYTPVFLAQFEVNIEVSKENKLLISGDAKINGNASAETRGATKALLGEVKASVDGNIAGKAEKDKTDFSSSHQKIIFNIPYKASR